MTMFESTLRLKPLLRSLRLSGLTLTELLVAMGIIATLLGLLVPTVFTARANSKRAACASNLRQVGMATLMYVVENQGKFPLGWGPRLVPGKDIYTNSYAAFLAPYASPIVGKQKSIFICPTLDIPVTPGPTYVGGAQTYAVNPLVFGNPMGVYEDTYGFGGMFPVRYPEVKRPAEVFMFIDSSQITQYGGSCDPVLTTATYPFYLKNNSPDQLAAPMENFVPIPPGTDAVDHDGRIRFRHIQKANAVMVDGHVESYKKFMDGGNNSVCEMKNRNLFPLR